MSMIGAKAQFAPTAAPSLPHTSPSLVAIDTSSVAAIDSGEPRNVPSRTIPLAPFSRFAATSMGIATLLRSRLLYVTASSTEHGRYMTPPGVQTLIVSFSASSTTLIYTSLIVGSVYALSYLLQMDASVVNVVT